MTGEHDYDITVQPFVCRNCHKTQLEAGGPRCMGGYRYKLVDAEVDGSIARRLGEIRAQEWRA